MNNTQTRILRRKSSRSGNNNNVNNKFFELLGN